MGSSCENLTRGDVGDVGDVWESTQSADISESTGMRSLRLDLEDSTGRMVLMVSTDWRDIVPYRAGGIFTEKGGGRPRG